MLRDQKWKNRAFIILSNKFYPTDYHVLFHCLARVDVGRWMIGPLYFVFLLNIFNIKTT
jgi:hypothetical protein